MDPAIETRAQGGASICSDSSDICMHITVHLARLRPRGGISRGEDTQVGDVAHMSSIEGTSNSLAV
jgi:hypothetical protein